MILPDILTTIGQFTSFDRGLWKEAVTMRNFAKGEWILQEGAVCQAAWYLEKGACYQYQAGDTEERIIDLHLPGEWVFNQHSLMQQVPSNTTIKSFESCSVLELSLHRLHELMARSQSFLQLAKIFNQPLHRTFLFDQPLSPAQKYEYVCAAKPLLVQTFPVKMIASYLKIAPETLSRIRARRQIS